MTRIGIIGVGEIARAIVAGLSDGVPAPPTIFLSPRGAAIAGELADRYANVTVCAGNQAVADNADVLVVAIRPQLFDAALADLDVASDTVVVSVAAGVDLARAHRVLGSTCTVVRAIPMPTVRDRSCVTVMFPAHDVVQTMFDHLGGALVTADEDEFAVYSALSGTLTAHYRYLATLAEWAEHNGVETKSADRYVRSLFEGVGRSLSNRDRSLQQLADDHETAGGLNERVRSTWFDAHSASLRTVLDAMLADLRNDVW